MARIAVTGATGFIGRHLTSVLASAGHEVRALARYSSDTSELHNDVEIVRGDVRSAYPLQQLVPDREIILHLAGGPTTAHGLDNIIARGTMNVLEHARDAGVRRIIFLSCLGANAADQSTFYAAKWQAETMIRASKLCWTILQPSLVLGRGDGVVRPLASLLSAFPLIPIPKRCTGRVQPIDIDDLCRCVVRTMDDEKFDKQTLAIGGPDFVILPQLANLVSKHLGKCRPRILVPDRIFPYISRAMPTQSRCLFTDARLAQFRHDLVVSPGIVKRTFGFDAGSTVMRIGEYLA